MEEAKRNIDARMLGVDRAIAQIEAWEIDGTLSKE
jgi:hypothetical protein